MRVPFLDLHSTYEEIQEEIEEAILKSCRSGQYIGGSMVENFERDFVSERNSLRHRNHGYFNKGWA